MRIHNIGLFLYSSIAILALTLVWGLRQVPKLGSLAEDQLRVSLEQELAVVRGAVRTASDAVKLRVIDVLRGDASQAQRALNDSALAAVALVDVTQAPVKLVNFVTKRPKDISAATVSAWLNSWPLDRVTAEQTYFRKVGEFEGQAYVGVAMRVRRDGVLTAVAVGVLPAAEFPLQLPTERARTLSVFDDVGVAVALNRSAYVGANLRRQPLISEILESDALNVRVDWTSDLGVPHLGVATRVPETNLFAAVESRAPLSRAAARRAWIYLGLAAIGAMILNWALFAGQLTPIFRQLASTEAQVETLRRLLSEQARSEPKAEIPVVAGELPQLDFVGEDKAAKESPPPSVPLAHVIDQALRPLEPRLEDLGVTVDRIGLAEVMVTNDILQLQTAFGEVLKNAVDSLALVDQRELLIEAGDDGQRLSLRIVDSGTGVDPDQMPRIFEAFYSTRAQISGVARGLGLNVVRRIIEEIGGSVVARNTGDRPGFRVELTWPREKRAREVAMTSAATDIDLLRDETEEFATRQGESIRRPVVRTPG